MKTFKQLVEIDRDHKSPEHKLFLRFMDIRNKSDKMFDQMHKMADQLDKIKKQMKKNGMDQITDHMDRPVFDIDDDSWQTVWGMFSNR
jgi:hypothetical protein